MIDTALPPKVADFLYLLGGEILTNSYLELPTFHLDAGETKEFHIQLRTKTGQVVDPDGAVAYCSILSYINSSSEPLLRKKCTLQTENDPCVIIRFEPQETVDFSGGKYVYQLTVKDFKGIVDILRGWLIICANGDKASILGK